MSKKAFKIASAAAVAASAFVAVNPAQAATAAEAEVLVKKAESLGGTLKWAISVEGSWDGHSNPDMKLFNDTKASHAKAVAAVSSLPAGTQKTTLQTRLNDKVKLYVDRAVTVIDAVSAGKKIEAKKVALETLLDANQISDKTVTAYNELSTEIRKQEVLLSRVYGQSSRASIREYYQHSAEAVKAEALYPVSVFVELGRLDAAITAKNEAEATTRYNNITTWLPKVENATMKAELSAKFEAKKSAYEALKTPKVESVSAINLNTIEVKFNKAVDATDATTTTNYTIDGGALTGSIALSSDKKTATITLTAPAAINSYKTVSVKPNAINVDGSTTVFMPTASQAVYFTDSVAPTLSGVTYSPDGEVLTVKFSETLLSTGTIKVYDENNIEVANETDFSATTGKSITLDTSAAGVSLANNKSYKIVIVGATDLAGNFFAGNRVETTFKKEKTDTVAPSFSSASVINNKTVRVTFSEAVQANAVTGKVADLSVDGTPIVAGLVVVDGTPTAAGEATEVSPGVYDVLLSTTQLAAGAHSVSVNNYKDLQGNVTTTSSVKTFQVNADTTAASLTKTEVANKVVTLTFDEDVVLSGTETATLITPDNVHISVTSADIAPATSKTVTVDLTALVPNPVAGTYQLTVTSGSVTDTAATPNTKAYGTSFSLTTDSLKPTVSGVAVQAGLAGNDTVVVSYNEDMGASATDVNNYLVDGQRVFQSAIFDGDRQTVKLTLKAGAFDVTGDRVLTIENVADASGNVINKVTRAAVSYKENTKPTIVSATLVDLDTVRVTFSEAGVANFITGGTADVEFFANGSTSAIAAGTITPVVGNSKAFDVDFAAGSVTDLSKTIQLSVLSGNDVVDGAGNVLGTTGKVTVTQ